MNSRPHAEVRASGEGRGASGEASPVGLITFIRLQSPECQLRADTYLETRPGERGREAVDQNLKTRVRGDATPESPEPEGCGCGHISTSGVT